MLKMNWMTDNEGRLVATWTGTNQPAVTPSYLRERPALQTVKAAGPAKGEAFLHRAARKYYDLINRLLRPGGMNPSSGLHSGPTTLKA
jgi:hypothetical protein